MDEKFEAVLSVAIVPQVVSIIAKEEKKSEINATKEFYSSKTYEFLSDENSKVWHYSPLTIYKMWQSEKDTGEIVFPEE